MTRLSRRRMILAPPPPPFSLLSRRQARPATLRKPEKERQLADGRGGEGVGEEPNHTTARKPGPLCCRTTRVYHTEPHREDGLFLIEEYYKCTLITIITGRQPPPLSSVLYRIIYKRRSVVAAQELLREKSGA